MPFTAAHPAIVLPILRLRHVSATGLVAGSVAPDFEYFFKLSVNGVMGHTWWGLLYFDVPVAAFLAFVFHQIVKRNLIANLPHFLQARLHFADTFDFRKHISRNAVAFVVCCWVGAALHVLWDNFTHNGGYFVSRMPFYRNSIEVFDVHYPMFYVMQQVSTFVGMLAVMVYVILLQPAEGVHHRPSATYWVAIFVIASAVIAIRFLIERSDFNLGNLVVTTISGVCIGLTGAGFIKVR